MLVRGGPVADPVPQERESAFAGCGFQFLGDGHASSLADAGADVGEQG